MVAMFDTTRNQRLCGAVYLLRLLIETVALIFEDQSFAISVKPGRIMRQISKPPFIVPFHPKHPRMNDLCAERCISHGVWRVRR